MDNIVPYSGDSEIDRSLGSVRWLAVRLRLSDEQRALIERVADEQGWDEEDRWQFPVSLALAWEDARDILTRGQAAAPTLESQLQAAMQERAVLHYRLAILRHDVQVYELNLAGIRSAAQLRQRGSSARVHGPPGDQAASADQPAAGSSAVLLADPRVNEASLPTLLSDALALLQRWESAPEPNASSDGLARRLTETRASVEALRLRGGCLLARAQALRRERDRWRAEEQAWLSGGAGREPW